MEPVVHLIDETWIAAAPADVAAVVHEAGNWRLWWPDLELTVLRDRGTKGCQWTSSGEFTGTVEIWLEAVSGGTLLHHFLRLDPARPLPGRRVARVSREFAWQAKRAFWSLKDELEGQPRAAGR